jgi:hypothetical protein
MEPGMPKMTRKTTPTVCIVESLEFLQEDSHREGEIIARTLRLSGKRTHYTYLRTVDELKVFAKEFGESKHRYLHLSCHGNQSGFYTTTGKISATDLAELLVPHVAKRRVFLSACLAAKSSFAKTLLENSGCWSVVAPVGTIYFDDAAIFWTSFYHLMFKSNPDTMKRVDIEATVEKCAVMVGEKFRFFYRNNDEVHEKTLG